MAVYLLKTLLLSVLFWGIYQLILRKEKSLVFNRFFLLFATTAPFLIPFWIREISYQSMPISSPTSPMMEMEEPLQILAASHTISWGSLFLGMYFMGVFLMLIRFGRKLYPIIRRIREGKKISQSGYIEVQHSQTDMAFSFLHFIFLPATENKDLLLKHELAHVQQQHSLDILWVEFLHCLAWFNPILILLKRAIRLNHEFLADQAVTRELHSPETYVYLLLEKASIPKSPMLVSPMSMGQSRERFEMIFTSNKKVMNTLKQILCLSLILASFQLFGREQIVLSSDIPQQNSTSEPTKLEIEEENEVLKDLHMEDGGMMIYTEMEGRKGRRVLGWVQGGVKVKFLNKAGEWITKICKDLNQQEREHFWNLDVSKAQTFHKLPPVKTPTAEQMKDFQNPDKYGLWLNGKRTPNHELGNFSPEKIHRFSYSRLMKNAAHYGQYTYHLIVDTKAYIARTYGADNGGKWKDVYLQEKEQYKKIMKK